MCIAFTNVVFLHCPSPFCSMFTTSRFLLVDSEVCLNPDSTAVHPLFNTRSNTVCSPTSQYPPHFDSENV